ncbi:diacylglycerol kinase kappa-like [Setaria italica]|uniref:diacylglycerol kinase kappa-like n=1 Tax=Setaria italica TaxID=4555 RepID=UPI00064712A2|nr:diacylglycerol kinase kappa-like [Setaria italica]
MARTRRTSRKSAIPQYRPLEPVQEVEAPPYFLYHPSDDSKEDPLSLEEEPEPKFEDVENAHDEPTPAPTLAPAPVPAPTLAPAPAPAPAPRPDPEDDPDNARVGEEDAPEPPRDNNREFMSHRPPTFSHSADPLLADDLLKAVEKILTITQCTNRERVLYASGRLEGSAANWWDAYTTAHADVDAITWLEFKNSFRTHHITSGLMKLKKKEFLTLK